MKKGLLARAFRVPGSFDVRRRSTKKVPSGGEFSAQIRGKRPAEPYNLKGIKYKDEVVRRKAGKTFVTGAT